MKINSSSWHYKLMSAYQYGRYLRDIFKFQIAVEDWCAANDVNSWVHLNYNDFKRFSLDTGKYLPMDFCSYWRSVLLWPGIATLLWVFLVGYILFASYAIGFIGFATIFGIVFMVGIVIAIMAFLSFGYDLLKKKTVSVVRDGFFSNVQRSLEDNTFCTVVNYEKESK